MDGRVNGRFAAVILALALVMALPALAKSFAQASSETQPLKVMSSAAANATEANSTRARMRSFFIGVLLGGWGAGFPSPERKMRARIVPGRAIDRTRGSAPPDYQVWVSSEYSLGGSRYEISGSRSRELSTSALNRSTLTLASQRGNRLRTRFPRRRFVRR